MNLDDLPTPGRPWEPVVTPCIRVCTMDRPEGHCQGCHRTLEEIMNWPSYTHARRLEIMAQLSARKKVE